MIAREKARHLIAKAMIEYATADERILTSRGPFKSIYTVSKEEALIRAKGVCEQIYDGTTEVKSENV